MAHIKSFGDIGNSDNDSEDERGDGKFNDYYAGGEKSGQLIRGAPKDEDKKKDKVSSLFEQAKEAGATQGTSEDLQEMDKRRFQGSGRTLAGGGQGGPAPSQQQGPVSYVITFYRNNVFTVNDGPPRRIDDPANHAFINSIGKGECPEELEPPKAGTPINVNLVRKEEEYKEPEKPKYTAFTGSGRTLGSTSAAAEGGAGSSSAGGQPSQEVQGEWAGVNEGEPCTSLQLRLSDGSRMLARFNHSHTVADIRRFIKASRPDMTFAYALMTGVPPAPISDESQTLEAAGLLNAVVIQRKQ